ncbi:MAG: hypothetical protein KDH15_18625 [Rhodocyclaceae bacterium]|nr:hypothetical protein [Rhodocyclaceae bacterium]
MPPEPIFVFLDFDGVTHPWGEVEDFRCMPQIERVLRRNEETRVVITSDWRTLFSEHKLAARFAEDLRSRVVGVTPHLVPRKGGDLHGLREREARQWLAQTGHEGAPWLAVDDAPGNWLTRSRLVLTDFKRGFTEEDAVAMNRLIERLRNADEGLEEHPLRNALWA